MNARPDRTPGTAPDTARETTRDTHLRVHCTADAEGRITFDLRQPATAALQSPQLLLRLRPKKGQPEKLLHALDLEPGDDSRLRAVLEPQPALAEGRWDVYLLPEPGAQRQRMRPGLRDLRALVDGHTRDHPSPVAVRVPYATKDGYLAVRAWLRTAHAEVEGIDVTDRSTTVRARLHGTTLAEGAAVRLRLRGGDGVVRTLGPQAESDGRAFTFTVDHEELVADHGPRTGAAARVWDVFVQPRPAVGAPPIRICRLLDDVADRKEIFVYPTAAVGDATVRPYFTVDNDLSVEVAAATA
ncbi:MULTISPECIES: transferase [unclassified Streptomyces]|uniref:transferase n=1 Tax=unclassified Streptomyces TaxID=2593676 RepID=UPI002365C243|nr:MULTISPECIES: transferase [unclassified Streptomyces]MDF3140145.1 transferase [Streptomyces sp. T21Q-yed]WDF42020.1 transferase [Streptomyces sp. T12]